MNWGPLSDTIWSGSPKQANTDRKVQTVSSVVVFLPTRILGHLLWASITTNCIFPSTGLAKSMWSLCQGRAIYSHRWRAGYSPSPGSLVWNHHSAFPHKTSMVNRDFTWTVSVRNEIRVDFSSLPNHWHQIWNSRKHWVWVSPCLYPQWLGVTRKASIKEGLGLTRRASIKEGLGVTRRASIKEAWNISTSSGLLVWACGRVIVIITVGVLLHGSSKLNTV